MQPIQTLMDEHRTIESALDALDRFAADPGPEDDARAELLRFVEFIRQYADRIHHGKEEDILFAEMVAAGFPKESGPIAVMLHEHDQGRAAVRELDLLARHEEPWSNTDRERLARAANDYTRLLRSHIHKEDNILYPMAQNQLGPDALRSVAERSEAFDLAESAEKARLEALAAELTERWAA